MCGGLRGDGGVTSQSGEGGCGTGESVGSVQSESRLEPECGGVEGGVRCYLMIWGQSLHALAFRLASASQAGSVDTCGESEDGKRFDTSLTAGGDGVESAISTEIKKETAWTANQLKLFSVTSLILFLSLSTPLSLSVFLSLLTLFSLCPFLTPLLL